MAKRIRKVGVIAEEDNDVDSVKVLIHRLTNNQRVAVRGCVGHGCGKVRRKCNAWSNQLKQRGCSLLIVVHDLDNEDLDALIKQLKEALAPCAISRHLICIPIQELEAWLLSDPKAIRIAMHLKNTPNIKAPPETINSPKEYLEELISRASNGERVYMNTRHNAKIAAEISIELARNKCPSFIPFYDFVQSNLKN